MVGPASITQISNLYLEAFLQLWAFVKGEFVMDGAEFVEGSLLSFGFRVCLDFRL